jgi:hypothetical protein
VIHLLGHLLRQRTQLRIGPQIGRVQQSGHCLAETFQIRLVGLAMHVLLAHQKKPERRGCIVQGGVHLQRAQHHRLHVTRHAGDVAARRPKTLQRDQRNDGQDHQQQQVTAPQLELDGGIGKKLEHVFLARIWNDRKERPDGRLHEAGARIVQDMGTAPRECGTGFRDATTTVARTKDAQRNDGGAVITQGRIRHPLRGRRASDASVG